MRRTEICGHPADDRYCSHVGGDPFIALPTKADNGAKTPGGLSAVYMTLCVREGVCVSMPTVAVLLLAYNNPGRLPAQTVISDVSVHRWLIQYPKHIGERTNMFSPEFSSKLS